MKLPSKVLEKNLFNSGYDTVIGVDEVGMGSLAGPVVVCAVRFTPKFYERAHKKLHWLRDSKLLNFSQRQYFVSELLKLQNSNFKFQISCCYPKTIDKVNIYRAARLAMRRAVGRLSKVESLKTKDKKTSFRSGIRHSSLDFSRSVVLVDGKNKINGLNVEQLPIVKGDRKVFVIACASIIAKVYRDRMMVRYASKYPEYGFEKHKGYGTKLHNARLIQYGISKIHRKSFSPISKLV